ncbi:MAG: hypothetical protein ABI678_18060, partial [Kofleriaceae bacterium]
DAIGFSGQSGLPSSFDVLGDQSPSLRARTRARVTCSSSSSERAVEQPQRIDPYRSVRCRCFGSSIEATRAFRNADVHVDAIGFSGQSGLPSSFDVLGD